MHTISDRYNQLIAQKNQLKKNIKSKTQELKEVKQDKKDHIQARVIVTKAIELTQIQLKDKIEPLVTMALQSVFDRDYNFELIFEEKRNKIEYKPVLKEGDYIYDDIKEDKGGGILPILSFALRIIFWSLENPKSRNVIILDEPIKGSLGGEILNKAIQMMKQISYDLGIQLILVTHYSELSDIADKVFKVTHNGKCSEVK